MLGGHDAASAGVLLSIAVAAVAILLVLWLGHEHANRDASNLSEEDANHFTRQDRRRGFVAFILLLLSAGISYGSRLEPLVNGRTNRLFIQIWLGIFVLVFTLLLLAMFDWIATRRYARRHLRSLIKERAEIYREQVRLRTKAQQGRNENTRPDGETTE
ncbi:hypothetical protein [Singulisphaera sp. PoT]|uniref:hypothetical protein n=1 Tax=Singulisphaera sp. PoT TaxID=3411797 RepID=UPI003BF5A644